MTKLPTTLTTLISRYAWRNRRAYASAAVMLTVIATLTVWIPRHVGALVDGLAQGHITRDTLPTELLYLLAAGAAIYGLRVAWRLQLYAASYRLGRELRVHLYERLAAQGPHFFQHQRTGDLMALATNDIDAVELAAGEALLAGFDGTLTLILVVAMMSLAINAQLALITLAPFPLMAWAFWRISNRIHKASKDALQRFSALNDFTQESLTGVRTVRALGLAPRAAGEMSELADAAAQASLRSQRWEAAYEPAVGLTLVSATVLILAMGGYQVWQGVLSVGALTAFSMYLMQLIWPMFAAGWVLSLLERGRAAWGRLEPVLNAPLSLADHGTVSPVQAGALRLSSVSFTYPSQTRAALSDITVHIAPGETLGVVGATGSGKSTLIRLLLRHYEPNSGEIHWGETLTKNYTLGALHSAMRWVPQEAFLFSASLAQNIALSNPDAAPDQITHAAQIAAIDEDIRHFPQGYDTPVGERGVTLSGGQRQRVAIARALLSQAPLLLLDDALSAVDTQTETTILSHLRARRQDTKNAQSPSSMVIVSHRLSAVMEAHEIIVLDKGHISERGTHAQLVAANGWYAAQWRYQQLEASLEDTL
jgi:ATP-binding cassette, subfamily B, multidrug efflux pump